MLLFTSVHISLAVVILYIAEGVTCCVTCPYLSNPYLEIAGCLRSVVNETLLLYGLIYIKATGVPPPPPPMLGRCKKQRQNADYSGETWVAGKAEPNSPRAAASLGEPMLGGS